MKMTLLVVSIVANIALATYLVSAPAPKLETRTGEEPPIRGVSAALPSNDHLDAATLRHLLVQQGIADDETKPIVLAYLNATAFGRDVSALYEYWRPDDGSSGIGRIEAAEQRAAEIRKTLIAVYGPEAQDDPAFVTTFRPMQDRLPFLSSEQQLALRRLQLERRAAGTRLVADAGPLNASGPAARPPSTAPDAQIRSILQDEATFQEYALRESSLAHRLRATGVEFTEPEFRAVYAAMDDFSAGASPNPAAFVAQREAVRNVLGRERALELWAATDPLFQAINQASQKHGVGESSVLDAYEAVVAAQDDLLRMTTGVRDTTGARDPRQAQQIRERIEQRDSMLRSLVGEAAARAVIEAISTRVGGPRVSSAAPPFPR